MCGKVRVWRSLLLDTFGYYSIVGVVLCCPAEAETRAMYIQPFIRALPSSNYRL